MRNDHARRSSGSDTRRAAARHPHDILLINLITNHILLFVILLGLAGSFPSALLLMPILSIATQNYILLRARRSRGLDPWLAYCHWQLCAQRSLWFLGLIGLMLLLMAGVLLSVGGDAAHLRPGHYAAFGVTIFPVMLAVIVLIVLESDAQHKARLGEISDALAARYPVAGYPETKA